LQFNKVAIQLNVLS